MSKVDPRTEKVKIFLMAVDPEYMYSNEAVTKTCMMISSRKKHFGLYGLYKKYVSALRANP